MKQLSSKELQQLLEEDVVVLQIPSGSPYFEHGEEITEISEIQPNRLYWNKKTTFYIVSDEHNSVYMFSLGELGIKLHSEFNWLFRRYVDKTDLSYSDIVTCIGLYHHEIV